MTQSFLRVLHGTDWEIYHLPLPSGHCHAVVRVLRRYDPVKVEISELTGMNIGDLDTLARNLLALQRLLLHPEGIQKPCPDSV